MAHQVKARITKCGDGMEHAVPDAPQEAVLGHKSDGKETGTNPLKGQGHAQDKAEQTDDTADLGRADGLLQKEAAGQPDPFPGNLGQGYGHGNHTHTANLDQGQDHQLPKKRPAGGRVPGRSAR